MRVPRPRPQVSLNANRAELVSHDAASASQSNHLGIRLAAAPAAASTVVLPHLPADSPTDALHRRLPFF